MFAALQVGGRSETFSPNLRADWLALQASLLTAQGKPVEALDLAKQALNIAPEIDLDTLGKVYLALASAYQQSDDPAQAARAYRQLILLGRSSGNIMTELMGISALVLMMIEGGQLRHGFELATQGIERVERAGVLPPISAGLYGELVQIAFHWGQLDQAGRYFQLAAKASSLGGFSDAEVFYAVARSRIEQMRGDLDAAGREIKAALQSMRLEAPMVVREEVLAQQINLFLAWQDLAAAERTLATAIAHQPLPDLEPGQALAYPQGLQYNCALRIQLQRARLQSQKDALSHGLELANRLLAAMLQRGYIPLSIETLLLRAQLHTLQGDAQAGRPTWQPPWTWQSRRLSQRVRYGRPSSR